MILMIRIQELLRDTVPNTARPALVTRRTGAVVRDRIRTAMATASAAPTGALTQLDFTEVGLVDFSCADEVVATLLREPVPPGPYLLLTGLDDAHTEAIDQVLRRQQLAVAGYQAEHSDPADTPFLLGWVPPDVRAAFTAVYALGPGDPSHLAEALSWSVERAADALQGLALRHLVEAGDGRFRPLTLH